MTYSLPTPYRSIVIGAALSLGTATLSIAQSVEGQATESQSEEPAVASQESDRWTKMQDQINDLSNQLKSLEEHTNKAPAPKLAIESEDPPRDKWKVKLGGHIQLESIQWANADSAIPNPQNYTNFRRLRLSADGTGYEQYDFRLQLTLEPDSEGNHSLTTTGLVKDAYFTINELPGIGRFRIGHFFVPFSLEQVTNDTNNMFLERSIPTQGTFAADRELGMAIYNATEDKRITWTYGLFVDSISEATKRKIDDNQGYRLSGRLTYLPFYDEASNGRYLVHTGVGVLHTDDGDNLIRIGARPQISQGLRLIDSGLLAASKTTTGNIEGAIVMGPVAFQSEAFLSNIDLDSGSQQTISGAYVHVSWFLTGENRVFERFGQHGAQFGRNKPNCNFRFRRDGWQAGAFELKARWSHLDLNPLDRGQYNDLTVGFNWYWSDRVRLMFDWIHPYTSETTLLGATESDILGVRWDVNW